MTTYQGTVKADGTYEVWAIRDDGTQEVLDPSDVPEDADYVDRFTWGPPSTVGGLQLASVLLADHADDGAAIRYHEAFKVHVVQRLEEAWRLPAESIGDVLTVFEAGLNPNASDAVNREVAQAALRRFQMEADDDA